MTVLKNQHFAFSNAIDPWCAKAEMLPVLKRQNENNSFGFLFNYLGDVSVLPLENSE